jgi:hypothetical protein
MECGGPIQEDWVALQELMKDFPEHWVVFAHQSLCRGNVLYEASIHEQAAEKWLEELNSHLFRQATLMELKAWPHNDNRSARVVNPLPQQILPESASLALKAI